jgi:Fur family zinc uptake transcriptional regulator
LQEVGHHLDQAADICRRHGVRFTELRREILSLILAADRPIGAYDLLDRLKETRGRAAPPTIYRAIEFLKAQGLIHRIELLNAFVACLDVDQHAHPVQFLICTICGSVDELCDPQIMTAIEQAAASRGFRRSTETIEIQGICCKCRPIPF